MPSSPISHEGAATVVETDSGEKRAVLSFPTSFCGHSFAAEFFQNRDSSVPEGPYLLEFVLGSEFMLHDVDASGRPEAGYSCLKALPGLQVLQITYESPPGSGKVKEGKVTPRIEGSTIRALIVEVPELDLDASVRIAGTIVHSILDVVALKRHVPAQIHHLDVRREVGNDRFLRRYLLLPYKPSQLHAEDINAATTVPDLLRPALRLFREGLNSSNPLYRFLCLYRVREALESARRKNDEKLIREGKTPTRVVRRVPDNELTREYFPDLVGKKLNAFLDHVYHAYRIPVAHVSFDDFDRMVLDPADVRVNHRVDYTNSVLIEIAGQMIEDEWKLMRDENL